jgi:hypothetical protein
MTKWSNRRVLIGCCVNVFLVLLHTGLVISQRQQIAAVRIILHPIIFCCILHGRHYAKNDEGLTGIELHLWPASPPLFVYWVLNGGDDDALRIVWYWYLVPDTVFIACLLVGPAATITVVKRHIRSGLDAMMSRFNS